MAVESQSDAIPHAVCLLYLVCFAKLADCSNVAMCVEASVLNSEHSRCPIIDGFVASSIQEALDLAARSTASADIVLLPGQHNVTSLTIESSTVRQMRGLTTLSSDGELQRPQIVIQAERQLGNKAIGIYLNNCSDVKFLNVDLRTDMPSNILQIVNSRNVSFCNVTFHQMAGVRAPIFLANSVNVSFLGCSFLGYPNPQSNMSTWSALEVSFDQFSPREAVAFAGVPAVSIRDANFEQLFDVQNPSAEDIVTSSLLGDEQAIIRIHFTGESTKGLTIFIQSCTFQFIQLPLGSPVHVHFSNKTSSNQLLIHYCLFDQIQAKAGGGMLVIFEKESENNSIDVSHTDFNALFASVQGGAMTALFLSAENNFISFTSCHFTQLLTDTVLGVGAAMSLFSTKPADARNFQAPYQLTIKDSQFVANISPYGIIVAHGVAIRLEGDCLFQSNVFGPIILYNSLINLSGRHRFIENIALSGGAISLYDQSHSIDIEVERLTFTANEAVLSGGAVYLDSSNGLAFVEWINKRIGVQVKEFCFLYDDAYAAFFNINQLDKAIQFAEEGDIPHANSRIVFEGNMAGRNGVDISTPSMTSCIELFDSCYLLDSISSNLYVPSNGLLTDALKVVNAHPGSPDLVKCDSTNHTLFDATVPSRVATRVNWLFFEHASCSCLKPFFTEDDRYWYFNHDCNATSIIQTVSQWLLSIGNKSNVFKQIEDPLDLDYVFPIPPEVMFYVPWSHSWVYHLFIRAAARDVMTIILLPSNITLTPAPGELFQLFIRGYDQFLRSVNASVAYLSLHPPQEGLTASYDPPHALLRQGSKQYAYTDSIIFRLNEPIADLSLVGLVNATGSLWVAAESIFPDSKTVLQIPFRLSTCHLGYMEPSIDKNETIERIRMAGTKTVTDEDDSQLTCQCSTYGTAIASCSSQGKTVTIKAGKWAGDLKDKYGRYTNDEPRVGTLDEVLRPEFNKQFAWGSCVLHYCSDAVINNNWTLERASPCQDGRTGPLCGHCRPGLSVTPFDLHCSSCSSSTWVAAGIFFTALIIVVGGIVLLAVAMVTDISTSTTFDSLLFIFQVTPYFAPVGTHLASVAFHSQRMFVTNICVSQTFHSLSYLSFQFAFPSFLLVMVITLALFSRCPPVDRLLTLPRALKAVVLVLLVTYANFTYLAMELLQANRLYTVEDPYGELVLFTNGSIKYTDPDHISFLPPAAAILILVTVLPFLAVVFINHPRVKPLSDIYTCFYNDKYQWWIGVNLFRRYLIAAIAIFLSVSTTEDISFIRHNALTVTIILLTVLQLICNPLRSKFANVFETIVLINLCFFSGLNIIQSQQIPLPFLYVVAFWPYGAGVLLFFYFHRNTIVDICFTCQRKVTSSQKINKDLTENLIPDSNNQTL